MARTFVPISSFKFLCCHGRADVNVGRPNIYRRQLMVNSLWEPELSSETLNRVEKFWLTEIKERNEKLQLKKSKKEKFYVLSMFPYPSGRLHMGHVRVYTISDTIAHFHRMNGKEVLHPMGWDAFGLPAENAAIERNLKPDDWTYSNISYMRKQLKDLATTFNWEREVTTCSPEYYRWTQYIFLRLFKAGLAYQKEAMVNWDPVDQTVLANEQVDENGCSWRSGAKVEQRLLRQWFLRMTHFSKSLQDGLQDLPDWPSSIKTMQDNWIGNCQGCVLNFKMEMSHKNIDPHLSVHTNFPELVYGAAYIVLSPLHTLLKKEEFIKQLNPAVQEKIDHMESGKVDIDLGINAINPVSGAKVPVFASSSIHFEENVEEHLGIPSASKEDTSFAAKHQLPFERVLQGSEDDNLGKSAVVVNSGKFSGMSCQAAREAVMQYARDNNCGGYQTSARQYDWLISRQRYWGTPIPVIHCPQCKVVPVPEEDLPVILPKLDSLSSKGVSPLTEVKEWYNVPCPKCNSTSVRETDTMDTFVDSAWYFLRYTDTSNSKEIFSKDKCDWLMPVDLYIGGKEHAILHLLYARFINHFLHQQGMVACKEPFKRLLVQGLVMGQSYKCVSSGKYLQKSEVDFSGPEPVSKSNGEKLEMKWEKMSKSKYNGVDPEESIAEFGVDTVRLFILSGIPPEHNMPWNVDAIPGVIRWKNRMWSLVTNFRDIRCRCKEEEGMQQDFRKDEKNLSEQMNFTIKEVSHQYTTDFMLSVAISRLMTFTNTLRGCSDDLVASSPVYEQALCNLCIMVAPMAPLMASEMWQGLAKIEMHLTEMAWDKGVLEQTWPEAVDTKEDEISHITLTVKINNQSIGKIDVPKELLKDEEQLKSFIMQSVIGKSHLDNTIIKRTVIAPKVPLVNFLTDS